MSTSQRVFKLAGKVQHYAWGGESFIPALLNISNQEGKPYAEYWMGAHDNTPAELLLNNGKKMPLNTFIEQQPAEILGEKTANRFGRLPFLFKVLDVKDMLSIQVHPTKREAEKGFERENLAGIPLSAPQRNYKDDNHKPEIMVALSDFWLLHGFKHQPEIEKTLNEFPAFHPLIPDFKKYGFKELYRKLMKLPQQEIDLLLAPLAEEILQKKADGQLNKNDASFWAARAIEQYSGNKPENLDRGIFSIYFLNLVFLRPGEAIYQPAGIPHAYLEGKNMELMANSDNVLRGGLTPKHIDIDELMKHTIFEGVDPEVISPGEDSATIEQIFPSPAMDFEISRISFRTPAAYENTSYSAEIIFVTEGTIEIKADTALTLHRGEAAFIIANTSYRISGTPGAICFKAAVPPVQG